MASASREGDKSIELPQEFRYSSGKLKAIALDIGRCGSTYKQCEPPSTNSKTYKLVQLEADRVPAWVYQIETLDNELKDKQVEFQLEIHE